MKIKEVRDIQMNKLQERLAEARAKLVKLQFTIANKQAKNVREARKLKNDIARFLTVLNERRRAMHEDKK